LNLLLASRQLHNETALLAYQFGLFQFSCLASTGEAICLQAIKRFLEARSVEQIKAIDKLRMKKIYPLDIIPETETIKTGADWAIELGV
jgi:hypothetical protein